MRTRPLELAPAADSLRAATDEYLTHKRVRLTDSSYRGYSDTLKRLNEHYPNLKFSELTPPAGTMLLEDFLSAKWGHRAGRTYNKNLSVLSDFCRWHFRRGHLSADPTLAIEKAREAEIPHEDFSKNQRARILAVNPGDREQIAIRLLLDYALRKGSLLSVRLDSFSVADRKVSFWMKGDRYHTVNIPAHDPIWRHLETLLAAEPGNHYLLPRMVRRRRTRPQARQMAALRARLDEALAAAVAVTDPACAFEIGWARSAIDNAQEWFRVADDSASYQVVQIYPAEPMGIHAMHDLWYHWLQRAGIVEKGVTRGQRIHKARHTAGQRMLEQTGNLKSVQRLLGHSKMATTGDNYVHVDDEHVLKDTIATVPDERLDDALMRAAAASLHIGSRA